MAHTVDPKDHPVTVRLRELRERLGYKKKSEFAKLLGISIARWANVENGYPVSRDVADKLKQAIPGLDLDYIYDGDIAGLSGELCLLLGYKPASALPPGALRLPLGKDFGREPPRPVKTSPLATRRKSGG